MWLETMSQEPHGIHETVYGGMIFREAQHYRQRYAATWSMLLLSSLVAGCQACHTSHTSHEEVSEEPTLRSRQS